MSTLSTDELAELAAIQPPDGFALPWHVESKGQTMKSDIYSITLFPKGMAAFITNCVNVLPRLLAAITEQRAEIARLRGLIGTVRDPIVAALSHILGDCWRCTRCHTYSKSDDPFPHSTDCPWNPIAAEQAEQKARQDDA